MTVSTLFRRSLLRNSRRRVPQPPVTNNNNDGIIGAGPSPHRVTRSNASPTTALTHRRRRVVLPLTDIITTTRVFSTAHVEEEEVHSDSIISKEDEHQYETKRTRLSEVCTWKQ